jgi:DNA-binding GntR family transcriptional regulator
MDVDTIRELYRTRAAILEFVARDVAAHATDAELASLAGSVAEMARACADNDVHAYLWANIAFHDLSLTVSKNRTAKRIVEALLLRTIPLRRRSLSQPGRLAASLRDHENLVEAYRNRDGQLASALVHANHYAALRNIERWLTGKSPAGVAGTPDRREGSAKVGRRPRRLT